MFLSILDSWDSGNPCFIPNTLCAHVATEIQRGEGACMGSHSQFVAQLELGPRPLLRFWGTLWLIDTSTLPSSLRLWPTFLQPLQPCSQW